MKNQPRSASQPLSPATVTALINGANAPLATCIEVPKGVGRLSQKEAEAASQHFSSELKLQPAGFSSAPSLNASPDQATDFSFGATQIDLALPKGALPVADLHELNPKHHKDQLATLQTALALAARRNLETKTPVFCFILEDQKELLTWLQTKANNSLNLASEQLVIITAKYSDDLLWAIEETIFNCPAAAIVSHFSMLDNTAAQRLTFLSRTKGVLTFLICNHRIEGPAHAASNWLVTTLEMSPDTEKTALCLTATYIKAAPDHQQSWGLKWNETTGRFSATSLKQPETNSSHTLH